MDPKHRDRVAFLRVVSGKYEKGMKLKHVRIGKDVVISDALTFMAGDRSHADEAYAGDISVCTITVRFKLVIPLRKAKSLNLPVFKLCT